MRTLSIASTGMAAQQTNVEVISNNIANMNTTGFKRSRAEFQDLLYQSEKREGTLTSATGTVAPAGVDIGLGVQTAAVVRLNTQGSLTNTNNQLDMALDGKGYFVVNMPNGEQAYTRAGSFQLSPEGTIVTVDGYEVDPGMTVPENTRDIQINAEGMVMAFVGNDMEPVELGQMTVATFVNETGLKPIGDSLFLAGSASGEAQLTTAGQPGVGQIRQGYVEASNVNVIQEITTLISAQRAYEMNSKVVESADQMMQTATNIR